MFAQKIFSVKLLTMLSKTITGQHYYNNSTARNDNEAEVSVVFALKTKQ